MDTAISVKTEQDVTQTKSSSTSNTTSLSKRKLITVGAIISTELCERLAYFGLVGSLTLFLRRNMGETLAQASTYQSIWAGVVGFCPLLGGYIADSKLGRFKTILIFVFIYLAGLFGISIAAITFESEKSNNITKTYTEILFWIALYTVALGTGGIKSNVAPLGAEQLDMGESIDETNLTPDEITKRHKELDAQQSSFFNWFYFTVNVGALISFTVVSYICQDVSFVAGYAIPTVALAVAIVFYLLASPYYYKREPDTSALAQFFRVSWAAWSNRHERSRYSIDTSELSQSSLSTIDTFNISDSQISITYATHWLDMAKMEFGGEFDESYTQFINDCKYVYDLMKFMLISIIYWCIYCQMGTMFYNQGCQMNYIVTTLGTSWDFPISSMSLADIIIILILVPVMDRFVYPTLETKFGIKFPLLQRIGTGYTIAMIGMIVAAITEIARKNSSLMNVTSTCDSGNDEYIRDLSIFWQIPSYLLIGVSEVLAAIASLEFFYDQAPQSMKSILYSLSLVVCGLGSWMGSLLIVIVNSWNPQWLPNNLDDGYLEYYYILLAILMCLGLMIFIPIADSYKYKRRRSTDSIDSANGEGINVMVGEQDEEIALLGNTIDRNNGNNIKRLASSSFVTDFGEDDLGPTCCGRFKFW